MPYITTTNTHKIIEVSEDDWDDWRRGRRWDCPERLVGHTKVGDKVIETYLSDDDYSSDNELFITDIEDEDGEEISEKFHSKTWEQAQLIHARTVALEKLKQ